LLVCRLKLLSILTVLLHRIRGGLGVCSQKKEGSSSKGYTGSQDPYTRSGYGKNTSDCANGCGSQPYGANKDSPHSGSGNESSRYSSNRDSQKADRTSSSRG
jgi:hypothetical protein